MLLRITCLQSKTKEETGYLMLGKADCIGCWRGAFFAALVAAAALTCGFAQPAWAELIVGDIQTESVAYLPDVTEDMTHASYWSDKQQDPTAVLADRATIDELNQAGIDADGTMLQPLKDAAERFYTQDEQKTLKGGIESDLASFVNDGAEDVDGNVLTEEEAAAIAANCPSDGSVPDIASGYAIVTTHTTMRNLPTDRMMGLTPGDRDDDNLYLSMLRVNEPLLVRAQSVDGKFFLCISSCMQVSWVPAEDVAICANREEWLAAWDISAGQELVVTGYKVRTEQSRQTPNTADRMLYMGTVLERVDVQSPEEALEIVGTRSAYNRHVCYLPVRNDDGTYSKELALIAESADVSEGYLPLTAEGIATTAFKSLGQMYGWGGMLEANDCSGYVRDVYKCFGLELARNTTWQMNLPVRKYDLSELDDAHKAAAIAQMPLGTVLFWGGHEMLYLGQENGKLYVISSLGGIGDIYGDSWNSYQVKAVAINTLDIIRANHNSWLTTLTCANVPYVPSSDQGVTLDDIAFYENSFNWPNESYVYTGEAIAPEVTNPWLASGTDFKVSFASNTEIGTATVTVAGAGSYTGSISRTFEITSAKGETAHIGDASIKVQNQMYTGKALKPKPTVKMGSITLKEGTDYSVSYIDNKAVGTALVKVTGKGGFTGVAYGTFKINKASQVIKAKNVSKKFKAAAKTKKLAKNKTINLKKLAKVSAKTTVKFAKANKTGGNKITVNASTGKITVKKGLAKKTYKVKVKMTAKANASYKAAKAKTITVKVVVA